MLTTVFGIVFALFLIGFCYVHICTMYWSVRFAFYRLSDFVRNHKISRK